MRDALFLAAAAIVPTLGTFVGGEIWHGSRPTPPPVPEVCDPAPATIPALAVIPSPPAAPPEPEVDAEMARPAPDEFTYGEHFAFVVLYDNQPYVVLELAPEDSWQGTGGQLATTTRASAPVDTSQLPAHLRTVAGRPMRLFDRHGFVGEGRLGAPGMVAEIDGDAGHVLDVPDPALADGFYEAAEDPEQWARYRHDQTLVDAFFQDGRKLLVAPILGVQHYDVGGPLWVRATALPMPVTLRPAPVSSALAGQAKAHLRRQSEFDKVLADAGLGSDGDSVVIAESIEVEGWARPNGSLALVIATTAGSEWGGCGGYYQSAWSALQPGEQDSLRPARLDVYGRAPTAVFDLDGDGSFEGVLPADFGTPAVLVHAQPNGWAELAELPEVPFFGCPC